MKKLISLLAVLALVASLCACSAKDNTAQQTTASEQPQITESGETEPSTAEPEGTEPPETTASPQPIDKLEMKETATMKETVLVDENYVKITATELKYEKYKASIVLRIENNYHETLIFSGIDTIVNRFMLPNRCFHDCVVAPGETVYDEIFLSYEKLFFYGITELADIKQSFCVRSSEKEKDYEELRTDLRQINISASETYDYSRDYYLDSIVSDVVMELYKYRLTYFDSETVFEGNGCALTSRVVAMGEETGNQAIYVQFKNSADGTRIVHIDEFYINGAYMDISGYYEGELPAGCSVVVPISLDDLWPGGEETQMPEITEIAFTVKVIDKAQDRTDEAKIVTKL